ncbi:MAG: hypothetical protein GY828_00385 [Candidatus Gracilibacteria bacterium]|nr:hypothetical protein [Candidatus Gracilibacteria bacterium]
MTKKKSFFAVLIILVFLQPSVFAEGASDCPIKNQTAPVLTDYIKNSHVLMQNVTQAIRKTEKTKSAGNNINSILNNSISWDGYFVDFEYYVHAPLFNEIPQPIKRDQQLLEKQTHEINKYIKNIIKDGRGSIMLKEEEVCQGVTECKLSGTSSAVLSDLLKNHNAIHTFFKSKVSQPGNKGNPSFILTPQGSNEFIKEISLKYGEKVLAGCTNSEGSFGSRISTSIDSITKNNQAGKDGIKKWKKGWAKLISAINGETSPDEEKNILFKELSRQGIPLSKQKIIGDNLDNFNSDNYSFMDNNPIINTSKELFNAGKTIFNGFSDAVENLFPETGSTSDKNKKSAIGISKISSLKEKNEISDRIKTRLDVLYLSLKSKASSQELATDKVISQIIQMHVNIEAGSDSLMETCETAVKVCNQQGAGKGYCGSCNKN